MEKSERLSPFLEGMIEAAEPAAKIKKPAKINGNYYEYPDEDLYFEIPYGTEDCYEFTSKNHGEKFQLIGLAGRTGGEKCADEWAL